MITQLPGRNDVVLKVGTLDELAQFPPATAAIYTVDHRPFHAIPEKMHRFERLPPRG